VPASAKGIKEGGWLSSRTRCIMGAVQEISQVYCLRDRSDMQGNLPVTEVSSRILMPFVCKWERKPECGVFCTHSTTLPFYSDGTLILLKAINSFFSGSSPRASSKESSRPNQLGGSFYPPPNLHGWGMNTQPQSC
jgi:hypothetical protein